ncbi:MAG: class I SAM-dependent methyltransferase [Pirellulales bacterium]|nr:class I SAM-dependent methyltransferase [Pirellulales bacterium]
MINRLFNVFQKLGIHVTPVHFYQPIPDTRELREELWQSPSKLVGVDLNESGQLALLAEVSAAYGSEYGTFPDAATSCPYEFYHDQFNLPPVDAEVLYCMVRKFKPRRMIEIGSGLSTFVAAAAIRKNQELLGHECHLTAIEPYPSPILQQGFPGLAELLPARVENVPMERFEALQENDILFIDSSHVVRIGGDVLHEYLEIIPRLRPGVVIHAHDIFLPAHYPRQWIMENHWFWTEQYLLQAFLACNRDFEVLWAGSHMHMMHGEKLTDAFPAYRRNKKWPGSFWMRRLPQSAQP